MIRTVPQHWLLFAGPADTGLAVRLEPVMSKNGVSLGFTPGPIGERLDIALKISENNDTTQIDAYRALEDSAKNGGGCGYTLLQSEDHLRCEATFRFQFEKKHLNSDALQNVSGASADLLFGLAVVTAVRNNLDYPPFAATGILNEDGHVLPIEGLQAKINAALEIPALRGGLLFYPKENDKDIDAELRCRVEQAEVKLVPVERLEEAVERLGISIQGTWQGNPYRRLDVFEYSHKRIYFGRENESADLADKLLQRAELGRPGLLILGPSGGGKSSLVQAGLIPELEKRFKDRTLSLLFSVWDLRNAADKDVPAIAASIRSSWSLLPGLAALAVNSYSEQQTTHTPLNAFSVLVRDLVNHLPDQTCFVWVLDQLEQFFTLGLSEETDAAFIHFLRELQARGIWIVATFRNDFYRSLRAHADILSVFKDDIHDLENLSEATIERIIQKPARLAKLEFEVDARKSERLSLKLKNDALEGGKDVLPLLEFALYQLYEKRELKHGRAQMTWAAYEAMGGLHGAIGNRADDVLNSLDDAAQAAFGRIVRKLTVIRRSPAQTENEANPFVACVANLEKFSSGTPEHRLVEAFAEARLFVRDRDNEGNAQVRVTHEALLTHWPKASEILRNSMKDLELRDRLADRVAHWKARNEDMSLLLPPGLSLVEAQDLLARMADELDAEIVRYIERSSIADQERKQKEMETQRRKTRFISITAVVLGVLLIIATSAGYFVYRGKNELTATLASSYFSEGARLVDQERSKEALAYLAQAMRLDSSSDKAAGYLAVSLLLSPTYRPNISKVQIRCQDKTSTVQFSPDGRRVLTICGDIVQVWDMVSGKPLFSPLRHRFAVSLAQFSPDGRWVITVSEETAQVWEAATGISVPQSMIHRDIITSAQFSSDGRWVITVSEEAVRVWEAATGEFVSQPMAHGHNVTSQFSPDGRWVVIASYDKTAQVWEVATGEPVSQPMVHEDIITSAQFSPDGRRIVTASSYDKTARVWEATTGAPVSLPMVHEDIVIPAQFSPDGRWVITVSEETVRIWEATTGEPVSQPMVHRDIITSAQFSPDGRWVITVSEEVVQIWEAATGEPVSQPMIHGHHVTSAQFSPDGRWVVTASYDKTARIWKASTGEPVSQPIEHGSFVESVQFSLDGCWIATATADGMVQVWETAVKEPAPSQIEYGNSILLAKLSPNGRWIVTASLDKTARVWEALTGKPVSQPMEHENFVESAEFSPDGRWVITASKETVRIWEATTGKPVSQPIIHGHHVTSARFSSDGRWIVTTSIDKTARVWEVATGEPVSQPMVHEGIITSAQFSPDGRWVVTASWDKTARVWEALTGKPVSQPMEHENFVESAEFSPDGRWIVTAQHIDGGGRGQYSLNGRWITASVDGMVQVWETATGTPVSQSMMPEGTISSAQFSPDGRWVVVIFDKKIVQVWEIATRVAISQPMVHKSAVESIQCSPDGRWVVTISGTQIVQVWETATGIPVAQLMIPKSAITSAQFSPDGHWMVTISDDETVRIWETKTGKPISIPFRYQDEVSFVQFSPDGCCIIVVSNTVHIWEFLQFPKASVELIEFIERLSGYSVTRNNVLQIKDRNFTINELREWAAATTDLTQEERKFINWWLSDPIERTVTSASTQTIKERVQMLINRDTIASLNEALDYYPGHSMALARLAAATWREVKADQQNNIRPRVALWANLALKYAPDNADVRMVAEKALQDIAQLN